MLIVLLVWLSLLGTCFILGAAVLDILLRKATANKFPARLSHVMWVGLGSLMVLAMLASLVGPLNGPPQFVVYAGVLVLGFVYRHRFARCFAYHLKRFQVLPLPIKLGFAGIALLAMFMGIFDPTHYDHGLYYAPTIKWIQEYGLIPGLGNLHPKLAFNSGWHVLAAFANTSWLGLGAGVKLSTFLVLLLGLFAVEGMAAIWRHDYRLSNFLAVLVLVPQHWLFSSDIASPATDYPASFLTYVALVVFIRKIEEQSFHRFDHESVVLIFLVGIVIATKITTAMTVFLLLWMLVLATPSARRRLTVAILAIGMAFAAPLLVRHVCTSGYLFYPVYQVDLFDVDWKIPAKMVEFEVEETRRYGQIQRLPPHIVAEMPASEWVPIWLKEMRTSERLLIVMNGLLLLSIPVFFLRKRKRLNDFTRRQILSMIAMAITLLTGLLYWLLLAPAMRMGYVWHFTVYLIVMAYGLKRLTWISQDFALYARYLLIGLTVVFFARAVYSPVRDNIAGTSARNMLFPPSLPEPAVTSYEVDGVKIYVPTETDQCYRSFPCAPMLPEGLALRDSGNIKAGFFLTHFDEDQYYEQRLRTRRIDWMEYKGRSFNGAE